MLLWLRLQFFEAYSDLLKSPNYVTRRQSLKVCLTWHVSVVCVMLLNGDSEHKLCHEAPVLLLCCAGLQTEYCLSCNCTGTWCGACFVVLHDLVCRLPAVHNRTTNRAYCLLFLQLLGELLLDRSNVNLMMRYVSDVKNLMQMMNLLKDTSRSIQFEAFHVFKVTSTAVSCPHRPLLHIINVWTLAPVTCQMGECLTLYRLAPNIMMVGPMVFCAFYCFHCCWVRHPSFWL